MDRSAAALIRHSRPDDPKAAFGAAPWMKKSAIELNNGLVAIIGARGSGKTALADIVAMGAHAKDAEGAKPRFSSAPPLLSISSAQPPWT